MSQEKEKGGMRNIYALGFVSFIPGTIALVLIVFFVKETIPNVGSKFELLKGIRDTLTADYRRLLAVVALYSIVMATIAVGSIALFLRNRKP